MASKGMTIHTTHYLIPNNKIINKISLIQVLQKPLEISNVFIQTNFMCVCNMPLHLKFSLTYLLFTQLHMSFITRQQRAVKLLKSKCYYLLKTPLKAMSEVIYKWWRKKLNKYDRKLCQKTNVTFVALCQSCSIYCTEH